MEVIPAGKKIPVKSFYKCSQEVKIVGFSSVVVSYSGSQALSVAIDTTVCQFTKKNWFALSGPLFQNSTSISH